MALTPGTRLGPYEVLAKIGAGGMGEVYKARDTRLTRTVAIKVLPADTADDAAAQARFEREARAIATLSHPHICVVHDVGRQDGTDYLVMELLEGETLAERLARTKGPLPLDHVLAIGIAIADALDKAHRAGIVHRDLKPGNVMLTKTGPKLLDFGLAKLRPSASPVSLSDETSETTAGPGTAKGTILGTVHYMAPEQLEGRDADARTDIWALGTLLYEMAAGQRPFEGDSAASIIGAILKDPPALAARQPVAPPAFEHVVERCLEKDPDERWQDVRDVKRELEWTVRRSQSSSAKLASLPVAASSGRGAWAAFAIVAVAAAVLAVPAIRHVREAPTVAPPETRTIIDTPGASGAMSFALSPDGRYLVFAATADGPPRLWLRPLASTAAQLIQGTEGAAYPFWSPDSKSIGFFADARLKRIDITGGTPQSLAAAPNGRGGAWNRDGVILYSPAGTGLFRVPAAGGEAVAVTRVSERQLSHLLPSYLPDGRRFIFFAQGAPDTQGIYLGSTDSPDTHRLTLAEASAAYLPIGAGSTGSGGGDGWLMWVRNGTTLVAQPLDLKRRSVVGDPVTVADHVDSEYSGYATVSVSPAGIIGYRAGAAKRRQLTWFDRSGQPQGTMGPPDENQPINPELSPDGRRAAVFRLVEGNTDIWLVDETGPSRFTFDAAVDRYPIWSPDGNWIVFDSNRTGRRNLYRKATTGASEEELLLASTQDNAATEWSPDGRFLLFRRTDPTTGTDIWKLPLLGGGKPEAFIQSPADERTASFSPDGRWVAYQSNASGPLQIYVRPVGRSSAQWQISPAGGVQPRWSHSGGELYYVRPDGTLMAVSISVQGAAIQAGQPTQLFRPRFWSGGTAGNAKQQYDVSADGRFLVDVGLDDEATPLTLLQNWRADSAK